LTDRRALELHQIPLASFAFNDVGQQQVSETSMLKDLLVHIPSERLARPVIDGAIALAMTRNARLQAVSIGYESANIGVPIGGGAAVAAVFEMEHEHAQQRANEALSVFDAEARNAGISYSLKPMTGAFYDTAAQVGSMARLADLAIVLQPDYERDTFDNTLPVEMLFQCGGPVLFIPYIHKGPIDFKRIAIAWDGSRLAARALRDAAPFLKDAREIAIISVNESSKSENPSAADLAIHLARRGLTAKVERADADSADIQATILSIAADIGLDLLVMGAYGHSRLQERLLGGVTRGMLQSMTVPTLMSH
jgi:nucleotide-binding universal stress UspA family protein